MTGVANLPSFNTLSFLSSSLPRAHGTRSVQRWGMETGLAFWSWFNLAVTPIADALKWLRRIVSAWWDLQLGGTSAPAAVPQHPPQTPNLAFSELWFWLAANTNSSHWITVNNFVRWISTWAIRWVSTVNISRSPRISASNQWGKGRDQGSGKRHGYKSQNRRSREAEQSEEAKKHKQRERWKEGRRDSDSHETEIYNQIIN